MTEKNEVLYVLLGVAVGAIAVYIYLTSATTSANRTSVVDLTRDASGRVITIVERKV